MSKFALCCGINDYPGTVNDLNGCVNDCNAMKSLFLSKGFSVTTLLNSACTKNGFISILKEIIAGAVAGDIIAISYSGHGTHVADKNGDEIDGYDEALYLYDNVLIDDEIREVLDTIDLDITVLIFLDSCFSGTSTRKISDVAEYSKIKYVTTDVVDITKAVTKLVKDNIRENEIFFSACADDEYSYDAYINGSYNGAFTYYLIKSFLDGASYESWFEALRKYLPSTGYPQTPQLEGDEDVILGGALLGSGIVSDVEEETQFITNSESDSSDSTNYTKWIILSVLVVIILILVLIVG